MALRRRKKSLVGFTLMELLLGLAIFGIIALSLYATFANAIRIHKKSQSVENIYRDARMALDMLTLDLENMVPYHSALDDGHIFEIVVNESTKKNVTVTTNMESGDDSEQLQGSFIGNETSLAMIVPSEDGLKVVSYYLKEPDKDKVHEIVVGGHAYSSQIVSSYAEENDTYFFIRSERSISVSEDLNSEDNGFVEEILSPFVLKDSLKFSYAVKAAEDELDSVTWQDSWSQTEFPSGVHAEVSFVNPDNEKGYSLIQKDIFIPAGAWRVVEGPNINRE